MKFLQAHRVKVIIGILYLVGILPLLTGHNVTYGVIVLSAAVILSIVEFITSAKHKLEKR